MATFFWGASTSAHQVEGGNDNDWMEWEHANAKLKVKSAKLKVWPEHILNPPAGGLNPTQTENYISGQACDHYNRFREDFDIAKQLGHNAHRFSIEWSRVEPEEGKFNQKEIEHYRQVVEALHERSLEPFVTLWHFTLPLWLAKKGGILAKDFPLHFKNYTEKITSEFGNSVKYWITLNEPEIYATNVYWRGNWPPSASLARGGPPRKWNLFACYKGMRRLIKAHNLAYGAIKKINSGLLVGASANQIFFESAGGVFNNLLKRLADRAWNFYFLNKVRPKLDFIGANYYFHSRINYCFNGNLNRKISDMGWEIYPEGIYHILKDLKKYGLPIYVTENGVADARDALRGRFIADHIFWMRKATKDGADVRGYFHWSLLDNFEWDKGFWPRFGLVEVDYKTMKRKIRPSALIYRKIIETDKV